MQDFSMGFDPGSLKAITDILGFEALLDPKTQSALVEAGSILVATAQAQTWAVFAHPTGALADSIYFRVASPTEVDVAVGVPYGRRREYGFSGMTDSLGRFYKNDPAKPYLQPSVDTVKGAVQDLIRAAVLDSWGEVGS